MNLFLASKIQDLDNHLLSLKSGLYMSHLCMYLAWCMHYSLPLQSTLRFGKTGYVAVADLAPPEADQADLDLNPVLWLVFSFSFFG